MPTTWPLRLFVGSLLHLRIAERDGQWRTLRFPHLRKHEADWPIGGVPSIEAWLHPNGWQNRRLDWPRLCQYGTKSASLYRAYLSVAAFMDQSARRGHAITAEIDAPIMFPGGRPKRRKGGAVERSAHYRVPNPAARYVAPLSDADLARMIGFDPDDSDGDTMPGAHSSDSTWTA